MLAKGRVIAGKYRHRQLIALFDDHTRTTKDRVKEAMFSALGDEVKDVIILDLFAGTGALGIEAISRGAAKGIFCENDHQTHQILIDNLQIIEEPYHIYFEDYKSALQKIAKGTISLVFIDPPYRYDVSEVISEIFKTNILKSKYTLVLETDKVYAGLINNAKIRQYKYGLTHVTIIRGEL
ncbi:MAG: Ribosomal RNA small subunit methyltransferase D [Tenericutes bacterium ADurb.Bin087]|nr:MAG: Ribosomal RNA small subunit methyltransferase D [Tenericutes bacterium ADurb.Bin087]